MASIQTVKEKHARPFDRLSRFGLGLSVGFAISAIVIALLGR